MRAGLAVDQLCGDLRRPVPRIIGMEKKRLHDTSRSRPCPLGASGDSRHRDVRPAALAKSWREIPWCTSLHAGGILIAIRATSRSGLLPPRSGQIGARAQSNGFGIARRASWVFRHRRGVGERRAQLQQRGRDALAGSCLGTASCALEVAVKVDAGGSPDPMLYLCWADDTPGCWRRARQNSIAW